MSDDMKAQLKRLRDGVQAQWALVSQKRTEAKDAEKTYKRMSVQAEALAKYLHELDGSERDCPGHEYLAEPSGRGIGYDERCRHCGYFRNLYPVY